MKIYKKKYFPLTKIRRFLEPGPIVLVISAHSEITRLQYQAVATMARTIDGPWTRNCSHRATGFPPLPCRFLEETFGTPKM